MIRLRFFLSFFVLLFLLSLNSGETFAEPVVLKDTEVKFITSNETKIDYELYISLPGDYNKDVSKRYNVVYLLDADYSFPIAHSIVHHMADRGDLPQLILVSVAYAGEKTVKSYRMNRTRDYTPIFAAAGSEGYGAEYQKVSGGASRFKGFFEKELFPYIEKNYRTASEKTLAGHSFGGLFGAWIILTQPALFDNYIIISPSLWYAGKHVMKLSALTPKNFSLTNHAYFAIGSLENSGHKMVDDIKTFFKFLKKRDANSFLFISENDDHNSIFPIALSKGLLYTQNKNNPKLMKKFGYDIRRRL